MIVTTTIDLPADAYLFFIKATEKLPDISPEEFMSALLTKAAEKREERPKMTKAELEFLNNLYLDGKLHKLTPIPPKMKQEDL